MNNTAIETVQPTASPTSVPTTLPTSQLFESPFLYDGDQCTDVGFSFGYELDGCQDTIAKTFDSLFGPQPEQELLPAVCGIPDVAPRTFNMSCSGYDSTKYKFREARITSSIDAAVFVSGERGGTVYWLSAGKTYLLGVDFPGNTQVITNIKFCFLCPSTNVAHTPGPTNDPTVAPSLETLPTMAPSESHHTSFTIPGPTSSPASGPTDALSGFPTGSLTDSPSQFPTIGPRFVSGSPKCRDLGFDYGWKLDSTCTPLSDAPFSSLDERTSTRDIPNSCMAESENVGEILSLVCFPEPDDDSALITLSANVAVYVKGSNGGTLHFISAEVKTLVETGTDNAIR